MPLYARATALGLVHARGRVRFQRSEAPRGELERAPTGAFRRTCSTKHGTGYACSPEKAVYIPPATPELLNCHRRPHTDTPLPHPLPADRRMCVGGRPQAQLTPIPRPRSRVLRPPLVPLGAPFPLFLHKIRSGCPTNSFYTPLRHLCTTDWALVAVYGRILGQSQFFRHSAGGGGRQRVPHVPFAHSSASLRIMPDGDERLFPRPPHTAQE